MGEIDQPVGRLAHRRDGADDPQAALLGRDEPARDVLDLLRVGDRRAAELHHDGVEVHVPSVPGRISARRSTIAGWKHSRCRRPTAAPWCTATAPLDLSLEREHVEEILRSGTFLWLDLQQPEAADLEILREVFDFHPLALEDSWKFGQRPKLDEYDDYVFLVVYGASPTTTDGLVEVHCFYSERYLVTVHRDEAPSIVALRERYARRGGPIDEPVRLLLRGRRRARGQLLPDASPSSTTASTSSRTRSSCARTMPSCTRSSR